MEEVWKVIGEGKGCTYEISTEGNLRSVSNWGGLTKLIKKHQNSYGYICYHAKIGDKRTHLAHRLVAKAFIPNSKHKPMVDHIDGNKTNNNVNNLRWATAIENNSNPNTQRRPKLMLESKKDNKSARTTRPCNNFADESRGKALYMDAFRSEDMLLLSDNSTFYFKFDDNMKVYNACDIVRQYRRKTGSKMSAHRDMINQIMKVVVETIVKPEK